ncbi:hypothetical protein [Acinetobacter sp. MD2]|uniref:hypothetical protein n=1 Tax=Acinetobacter sp. MD2 TaxID=2600066 RepID=UPI002D770E42|nr:hypothetical protein [Acinetobacter sp. MD2]
MSTLKIQDIFSHFEWYQSYYLTIIQNPSQYYQPVEAAEIHFGFLSEQKLYLGDLLQLWFGHKWIEGFAAVQNKNVAQSVQYLQSEQQTESFYLFSIFSDRLQDQSTAFAWSTREQKIVTVNISQTLDYYLGFIGLARPKQVG